MTEEKSQNPLDDPSLELSAMRTALAFQRTRMTEIDRTQMAVMRTGQR